MKHKIKFLSDCELRVMFLFWSMDSPVASPLVESECQRLGWDCALISSSLNTLVKKGLISRHWLGHGSAQKEFYMTQISERDYWRNTGCINPPQAQKCVRPALALLRT